MLTQAVLTTALIFGLIGFGMGIDAEYRATQSSDKHKQWKINERMLSECQAELPRNQTCELVAQPREEG